MPSHLRRPVDQRHTASVRSPRGVDHVMKSGFSHFDRSHCEDFLASVLLLAMENDDAVREVVARLVRDKLGIEACPVTGLSREVRLAANAEGRYARADLCLDFGSSEGRFSAFIEVKTHDGWDDGHVAHQVADQASRTPVRVPRDVRGSILLAPERVCRWVASRDPQIGVIPWRRLIDESRALSSTSPLSKLAIQHLEENVDRTAGLRRRRDAGCLREVRAGDSRHEGTRCGSR